MLAIKLKLIGKKGQHSFRVIIQEKRSKLQGKFTDDLGWYNPHTNEIKINQERLKYWLDSGAQPTETVNKLIKQTKTSEIESFAGRTRPKKKKKERAKEGQAVEAPTVETPVVEVKEEAPVEEVKELEETPVEEAPKEEEVSTDESKEE
ncbi:MAG: 30S ribosomal protein S16 [Candidatus Colwellbacteria bacterium CG10_big_fil_rev_8_21_14_0_10_41_28]|uniref:Small ribosomal subunit protein bS16 n=1 Tax=Candidatus Colwellbacteria bacterium CG10_big_fil_rev_8_21_14_0_10_41_28 TaxID=1974539 RepID=A0A2H0VHC3_9BACT|nr:MAG: 30S ribosomal protein S16 [Candidatus Colwellbacteria bacterium CG10_big_fil_rev_8_21_14_0_10_41_28]